ncbi:unnamed protein product [Caenorhabditis brenneri]
MEEDSDGSQGREAHPGVLQNHGDPKADDKIEEVWEAATRRGRSVNRTRNQRNTARPVPKNGTDSSGSDEICRLLGLKNVVLDYDGHLFHGISGIKSFQALIRPVVLHHNPGAVHAKILRLIQEKFEEFQNHMAAKGKVIHKAPRNGITASDTMSLDQSGPLTLNTRRSSRKRNVENRYGQESDQEFEEMMTLHEGDKGQKEEQKERRRQKRETNATNKIQDALEQARATRKARLEKGEAVEPHLRCCAECDQAGELVMCSTCERVYHCVCIDPNSDEPPKGVWSCVHCMKNGPGFPIDPNVIVRKHTNCQICKDSDHTLLCATCPNAYHAYCLNPPLDEMPDDEWFCPRCMVPATTYEVEKIISWRWTQIEYPAPLELKVGTVLHPDDLYLKPKKQMKPRQEKEFFVKYKKLSYLRCVWLSEVEMEVYHDRIYRPYLRRTDMEHPPVFDEFSCSHHHGNDPYNLRERFFQFGVNPENVQVHKIINHKIYGRSEQDYYVVWRKMDFCDATWERCDDKQIPNFEDAIIKYWIHRERMLGDQIPKNVLRMIAVQRERQGLSPRNDVSINNNEVKVDLREKYETQPDYVTGGTLHPYQLEGINWLRHCWSTGTDAILADEMGLGKTIQSLTFLYSLMKEGHSMGPFLIAAPLSTIRNWEREAEQWCPDFYVITYTGNAESREIIRDNEFSFAEKAVRAGKLSRIRNQNSLKFHVLLTSYEIINNDKTMLSSINWDALVVDEAHRLKNNESLFFKNLLDYRFSYRLLLTGTPLQNNLDELFHLLNFLSPDRFNELETFKAELSEISKEDQINKLHALLGPHMLRRLKADVLTGMPTKSELIVRVELSPMQKTYYKNILTRNFEALNVKNGAQVSLNNILVELKKCCNHPYLFAKASIEAPKRQDSYYEGEDLIKNSGKFILLQKMMRKLKDGGHRVLIFSQMTMMLDILEDFCHNEDYQFERIDGNITGEKRQEAIDRFNDPESQAFVFLLSTRAGGLGINLATADTVIIYDSDWNPHNDTQALSRAHRLGQKNKVMIYRFVTKNSVEERITSVAKKKMLLTHLVVRAGRGAKEEKMSKSELDDVLRWGTEELFKEEETTADGEGVSEARKTTEQEIVWDDAAVDFLLDRDKEEEGADGEKKEHWTNEYLSSFKVATYHTKSNDKMEEDAVSEDHKEKEADPNYWEKLLKHRYEQDKEGEREGLGKGKRQRRQVNYTNKMAQNMHSRKAHHDDDGNLSDFSDGGELVLSDDDFVAAPLGKRSRSRGERLPSLLAENNGQLEVLGFTPRQRRVYLNAILRWGAPPEETAAKTIWRMRDLRQKTPKQLNAYTELFFQHLCETENESPEFRDGVPKENFPRNLLLVRIGIMSLIRKKVAEFERYNGKRSMPEIVQVKEEPIDEDYEKGNSTNHQSTSNTPPPNVGYQPISCRPRFKFNICDGGFTELHPRWGREAKASEDGKHYEVWNRLHDFWLLFGTATHGYSRSSVSWQDVCNDPRCTIINEAFNRISEIENKSYPDIKARFIQQRLKLLEQSLVIEEQLRRAASLNMQNHPENIGNLAHNYATLEFVADAGAYLSAESRNGDRNANVVLHKALDTISTLLDNMRTDIQHLPTIVNKIRPVTDRLQMSEERILSRLEPGNNSKSLMPPSGPFITPFPGQVLHSIQPNFPALCLSPEEEAQLIDDNPSQLLESANFLLATMGNIGPDVELMDTSNHDIPSTSAAPFTSNHHSYH